ncbi:MAG: hypothetical protein ACXVCP_04595 [Bdellovibrio sp.]
MRFILILISITYSIKAGAFTYQLDDESLVSPSIFQRYQISQYFSKAGFTSLADQSLLKSGQPFDGVYISDKWDKSILLKAGLKAPPEVEGRIIEEKSLGLLVFHFQFEGVPYLLVAINLSKNEFINIVAPFQKQKFSQILSYIFPSAHAGSSCPENITSFSEFRSTANYIQKNVVFQNIGRCGTNALQSLKDSTKDTLDFFKGLSGDPKVLWNSMKESYNDFKSFALNMNSEIQKMFETIGTLTTEQKAQIACNITGKLIVKAGRSLLLPGGLIKLLPSLMLDIKKTAEILKKITQLEGYGFKIPEKSFLVERALSCVK